MIFLKRAGTIILGTTIILWALASFPLAGPGQKQSEVSIAGRIASGIEVVVRPIGFNRDIRWLYFRRWRRAKSPSVRSPPYIRSTPQTEKQARAARGPAAQALATADRTGIPRLVRFAPQCISTIAVTRRETNGWRWPIFMIPTCSCSPMSRLERHIGRRSPRTIATRERRVNGGREQGDFGRQPGRGPGGAFAHNGGKVVNLRVATSEQWKDRDGKRKERTEWHNVDLQRESRPGRKSYLRKGSKVYLEGQIQTRKWPDQSGNDRYSTEIVLQKFRGELVLLDSRGEGGGSGASAAERTLGERFRRRRRFAPQSRPQPAAFDTDLDDDVPF